MNQIGVRTSGFLIRQGPRSLHWWEIRQNAGYPVRQAVFEHIEEESVYALPRVVDVFRAGHGFRRYSGKGDGAGEGF